MEAIEHVLVTARFSPEGQQTLLEAFTPARVTFCDPTDRETIAREVADAEVCILAWNLDEVILSGKKLKWVHSCIAGVERSAVPEVFERGIVLTSSAGRSADALAEHALMFMLGLTYDVPQLERSKAVHEWRAPEAFHRGGLRGKTVGIVGLGQTGQAVARLCKSFGMKVLGWRRSKDCPAGVDWVYSVEAGESLLPLLRKSDYVVLCTELNDETWHLMDGEKLAMMKPEAFLINMGRGALTDQLALTEALRNGTIAGAGLDVFASEPLPGEDPLWDLPNVMITPHATPAQPDQEARTIGYILKNLEAFRRHGNYVNRIEARSIYSK